MAYFTTTFYRVFSWYFPGLFPLIFLYPNSPAFRVIDRCI